MQHDYTDEEIRTAWKDSLSLHAFLDALPDRPQPVVVNELSKDEKQPDLSGESEKQDPYARLKAYTKAGARIKCTRSFGASDWIAHNRWPWKYSPECYEVHPDDLHMCPEYAPVWTPAVGNTVRLKSGGPVMVVHYIAKDGSTGCVHNNNGHFEFTTVPAACLTPAKP